MEKLKKCTPNLADENFKKHAALIPDAVTETINENGEVVRATVVDTTINFSDYDSSHLFVTFYQGEENICIRAALRGFIEEMDYWNIEVKSAEFRGKIGFVVQNNEPNITKSEIMRFIWENFY